ncbi:MAG: hypothetical protein IIA61_07255 [Candidatus Marinimicrobia bacterium]|nr:hypothetical protein [Candidatus Neomarinimicrobiota bacterium]
MLLVFGSTTYSTAGLLAAFMTGLALGSALIARWGARITSPLKLYAVVEGGIALYAIVFSKLLDFINSLVASGQVVFIPVFHGIPHFVGGASLILPTVAMGVALPLLAFAFENLSEESFGEEKRATIPGMLYGLNTLGAVAGVVGTGFFFLPSVGMQGTLGIAVILSLITVGLALSLNIRPVRTYVIPHSKKIVVNPWQRVFLGVLLLSGACSLGYELIWTRILILIIGSSTYAFSLTVGVFILGTSLGSLYMGSKARRLRSPAVVFSHLQVAIGLLALTSLYLYGHLPGLYLRLFDSFQSSGGILFLQFLLVGVVMLPPTFLIGVSFPLAVRIIEGRASMKVGKPFSLTFGWVSAGNVVGVLAASLLLMPKLGLQGSIAALALANIGSGLIVAMSHPRIHYRMQTVAIALAAFIVLWIFHPRWDPVVMTSGVYAKAPIFRQLTGSDARLQRILDLYRMRFYSEGIESVVSVVQMPTLGRIPYLALAVDGKVDASTGRDMSTQVLSGHLPFVFHPKADSVLVIGLASGITMGSVATHPVSSITCVEIEPSMKQAARIFDSFNNGVLDDPRVTLVFDDGRHYLHVTKRSFDLIISEPSNPWMSGPSRLFTLDFFQLSRSHLNPGGLFVQWLPLYGLGPEHLRSLVRSFLEVFPHSVVFRVSDGDLLLIGGLQPLVISTDAMEQMFRLSQVRADLKRVGIKSAGDLLSYWQGASETLKLVGGDAMFNTDDNGFVEFGAPGYLHKSILSENLSVIESAYSARELVTLLELDSEMNQWAKLLIDAAKASLQKGRYELTSELVAVLKKEGESDAAAYIRGAMALEIGSIENARTEWQSIVESELWGEKAAIRLAELEVHENNYLAADTILSHLQPRYELAKYDYLRGIVALQLGQLAQAQTYFQLVSKDSLKELHALLPFYRWLTAVRTGDPIATERYAIMFVDELRELRRAAERDERLPSIDTVVEVFGRGSAPWLAAREREQVEYWLMTELYNPLEKYYQGVSFLFSGRPEEASVVLQEAGESLRKSDPGSMIFYYLALAQQMNSPENALELLYAFAEDRNWNSSQGDWLADEVSHLISQFSESDHNASSLEQKVHRNEM